MTHRTVIEKIRDSAPCRIFIAATGAGLGLPGEIWKVPGCSSFFAGAALPYATEATDDFLGFKPEKYCAPEIAIDLAMESYRRAFVPGGASPIGIGVSASVASLMPHRGVHRVFAASFSDERCTLHAVELSKGSGDDQRLRDGAAADAVGLNAILDALGMPLGGTDPMLPVTSYALSEADHMARERLYLHPHFRADGTRSEAPDRLHVAFPGSFDPPHEGHFGVAKACLEATGRAPTFWITTDPPHKPAVPVAAALRRAKLLRGCDVLLTRDAPLFLDKARRYPGCSFVVGADTLVRLLDARWGPAVAPMVDEFRRLGTRFLVVSRRVDGPDLLALVDIEGAPADLCTPLPGRWDVSSSEIRARL